MLKKIFGICLTILLLYSTVFAEEKLPEQRIPIDAKLEYNHGLDLYKLGQYEDAIACFRTAIRLYPDFIDAYYNLGSILDYLNQGDEAVYILKQIVSRKSDDYEAVYKIVQISCKIGDITTANQYVSLVPSTSDYYVKCKELISKYNLQPSKEGLSKSKIPQMSGGYLNIDSPTGIATDNEGNVYVASYTDNAIIKITPENNRIIFFKSPMLNGPLSIAIDSDGNMFIANYNANNVIKVSKSGRPEIFIDKALKPYSVHVGGGMLFVSCQGANAVLRRKIK